MKAWAVCRGRKILRGGMDSDLLISTNKKDAKFHCRPEDGEKLRRVEVTLLPVRIKWPPSDQPIPFEITAKGRRLAQRLRVSAVKRKKKQA